MDLSKALAFALVAHGGQTRKGSSVPYVSHLLQVSGLVLEHNGDPEQACAALLHDVVEDTPVTLAQVAEAFGPGVAAIVADCTDTMEGDAPGAKRPWLERKHRYVAQLAQVPQRSALVVGCDKLHNMRSLVGDLETHGPAVLSRFNAPPESQRWLHGALLGALNDRVPGRLHAELRDLSERYAALTGEHKG
ncbi:MAG: bifunctional (p)ppGpp synthetase/guanosine-3',5'-bis(diphosphate) 3'-pyrophosphohydrolase [Nannocystis sp.]|nr:HD domain-containing protein [Nannocystis sp.]MBA3547176.1 bifunctional (p)ppGpp synthetase/guanosine-3',5'-bis(diphosphate) 3'-pyrophosphohydrolase [Nannocystis sp.]